MISNIFKVIILIILIVVIGWIGLSIYSCYNRQDTGMPNVLPDQDKVPYSVYIENTGNLLLTDDYEMHGTEIGSRVFILKGFWELSGQKFEYKDAEIILDEAIFGEITIKLR